MYLSQSSVPESIQERLTALRRLASMVNAAGGGYQDDTADIINRVEQAKEGYQLGYISLRGLEDRMANAENSMFSLAESIYPDIFQRALISPLVPIIVLGMAGYYMIQQLR